MNNFENFFDMWKSIPLPLRIFWALSMVFGLGLMILVVAVLVKLFLKL